MSYYPIYPPFNVASTNSNGVVLFHRRRYVTIFKCNRRNLQQCEWELGRSCSIFFERTNQPVCSTTIIFASAMLLLRSSISFLDKLRFFAIFPKASSPSSSLYATTPGRDSLLYFMKPPMMAKNPCVRVHPYPAHILSHVIIPSYTVSHYLCFSRRHHWQ
jgi:hypothetical protein